MPQQVNMYVAARGAPRRTRLVPLPATAALGLLSIFFVSLFQVTDWNKKSTALEKTFSRQAAELQLRKAQRGSLQKLPSAASTLSPGTLQLRQATWVQRVQLRDDLRAGLYPAGGRYSDRLQWVAQSIPAKVWIDHISVDSARFELAGFTWEPSDISQWVTRLATSPAMEDLRLEAAEIQSVPVVSAPAERAVWSFRLVNARASSPHVVGKDVP